MGTCLKCSVSTAPLLSSGQAEVQGVLFSWGPGAWAWGLASSAQCPWVSWFLPLRSWKKEDTGNVWSPWAKPACRVPSHKGSASSQVCWHVCELPRGQQSFPHTWILLGCLHTLLPSQQAEGDLCDTMALLEQQMNCWRCTCPDSEDPWKLPLDSGFHVEGPHAPLEKMFSSSDRDLGFIA